MSAFPESGRSDQQKLGEIKVRFRPKAVVPVTTHNARNSCRASAASATGASELFALTFKRDQF